MHNEAVGGGFVKSCNTYEINCINIFCRKIVRNICIAKVPEFISFLPPVPQLISFLPNVPQFISFLPKNCEELFLTNFRQK